MDEQQWTKAIEHFKKYPPRRKLSRYEMVKEVLPRIETYLAERFTWDDIAEHLQAGGLRMTRNTLRTYVSRARKEAARTSLTNEPAQQEGNQIQ